MAVRILGMWPVKLTREIQCQSCGAVLEYHPGEDVQSDRWPDGDGGMSGENHIVCPHCQKRVVVESF